MNQSNTSRPVVAEFDAEQSLIKMTPTKLISLIVAIAALAVGGTSVWASHVSRIESLEKRGIVHDKSIEKISSLLVRLNGKMDALVLGALNEPGRRGAMQSAVRKVRKTARVEPGSENDPLRGLQGL